MKSDSVETIRHFVDAINRHDTSALLNLLTPDHRFVDSLGNSVEGHKQVSAAWEAYFQMVPDYHLDIRAEFGSGSEVALFGTETGTLAVDGALVPENCWSTPVAIRASVESHRVRNWQVFADNEPIRAVMRRGRSGTGG